MSCEHKRLKSVDCVLYCADCGARLEVVPATRTSSGADAPPSPEGKAEKAKRTRKKKAEGETA